MQFRTFCFCKCKNVWYTPQEPSLFLWMSWRGYYTWLSVVTMSIWRLPYQHENRYPRLKNTGCLLKSRYNINHLNPMVNIIFFLPCLYTFLTIKFRRNCFIKIKVICLWWSLPWFSQLMLMIICLYCEVKFDADHPWGFKDNNNSRTVMQAKLNECYISKKVAKKVLDLHLNLLFWSRFARL